MPPDVDGDLLDRMSPYDRRAWEGIQKKREKEITGRVRRLVPDRVRQRAGEVGGSALARVQDLPGAAQAQELMQAAAGGLAEWLSSAAGSSVRRTAIASAYSRAGHPVASLGDIRGLRLEDVDDVKPRFSLAYTTAAATSGAGAALAMTGGEFGAAAGAIVGAGAGAAPGVGTVAAAMAADAALTLGATMRLIAHTAAYYGYDVALPEEQLTALGVLDFATAGQSAKTNAYFELNKLMNALARSALWESLDQNLITKLVRPFYTRLGERLIKTQLASAAPVVGIAIGAGMNATTLARAASRADLVYRERFLREQYGIENFDEHFAGALAGIDSADVPLAELVDEMEAIAQREGGAEGLALRFDPAEIQELAARYEYADDHTVVAAGQAARRRGYFTRAEFLEVCRWKTPRSAPKVQANSASAIRMATSRALAAEDPIDQVDALTALSGVGVPTASALLHFACPESFPILDVRALWSLGMAGRSAYSATFWVQYVEACRAIASRHNVSMRTLDKALWQYSKEQPR
jgi:hypothetical protein